MDRCRGAAEHDLEGSDATHGRREDYRSHLNDWGEDDFFDLDIKVYWVKKCKNFARLLELWLCGRISNSGLPGD